MKKSIELDLDDILDSIEIEEIIDYYGEDSILSEMDESVLVYELRNRKGLDISILEEFNDEDIIYELRSRGLEDELLEELDSDGELKELKSKPLEYHGMTTNQEKEHFRRYLCDVFNVNYHTSNDTLLEILKTKLI